MIEDNEGFFLSMDNDGHWFIIPVERRDEWNDWIDLDQSDEASWDVPEWADDLNGSPSNVIFHSYQKA